MGIVCADKQITKYYEKYPPSIQSANNVKLFN